jgi:hypothetical protein
MTTKNKKNVEQPGTGVYTDEATAMHGFFIFNQK